MNADDYRAAIAKLGMTQRGCARFFHRNPTTGQRWAKEGVHEEIDMWLRFMLAIQANMHIKDVPAWINLMIGRKIETRGSKKTKISP